MNKRIYFVGRIGFFRFGFDLAIFEFLLLSLRDAHIARQGNLMPVDFYNKPLS